MIESVIEDENLSVAWARALQHVIKNRSEVAPLIVSVTGFDQEGLVAEDERIRSPLERLLSGSKHQTIETVASTIFPASLWNPSAGRAQLFSRYERIRDRVLSASRENQHGIYFERMITGGPPNGEPNQLEFIISSFRKRRGVRRSALQVATFDPARDHSASALRGFPCLQHVTFAPTASGLNVNAFYATQYMVERAYGNYLGLCRLGRFVAHELGIPLKRFTCFTGIALKESGVTINQLKPLTEAITEVLSERESLLEGEQDEAR